MKAKHLGAAVSLSAGMDKPGHYTPAADVDAPRDVHESHAWVLGDRWSSCAQCGTRDYFPGASEPCIGAAARYEDVVSLDAAIATFCAELDAFRTWWRKKGHENDRPSLAEWLAEWHEWRRAQSAQGKKRK